MKNKFYGIQDVPPINEAVPLSFQHVFAMFGATILVPLLTGLDPAVTLFTSGLGTLIFHLMTKGKVPAYLGSSFAFIAPIIAATKAYGVRGAFTGMIAAGLVYVAVFIIISLTGIDWIERILPSVVVGPVVMIIGLSLAPTAIQEAQKDLPTALVTAALVIIFSMFGKGFMKVIPILLGTIGGYIFAIFRGLVDFSPVLKASWIAVPKFSFLVGHSPVLAWGAVTLIAPLALVAIIEDLGHVLVIGNIVDKDLIKDPGFHRVMLGNGLATSIAALFGGPPSTTYGENIGVLAMTKVYSSRVIEGAAVIAILLSFIQKIGALIQVIPQAVMGGVTIILFGMIAAAGIRTLVENKVDFSDSRNLIIASVILTLGVGGIKIGLGNFVFEGVGPATLAGIILNLVLPKIKLTKPKGEKSKVKDDSVITQA
ncbi:solute carrier family 23 protein [Thermoanaerobacterium thermosaccharolyticum]|uniref:Uracil-xanthine permease n=1 Tax=Thermoanaerobacterium thermosaccharolyticum (strain ATCC 7956 / DSM 571 / NCIMB 9385 / NCA 3814 / NCTC 13789 / WDCM 00135 / 2032) TaxID=580327 RepID=D9TQS7_THETC|nr:solute carrier family 23 protein [Thermoanaerobacterium thermosaccharolyticum]ADL67903.1 uracil-xanthine permease [Thermoanaerobacterium thermosaccharolyticum DSM 571]KAA5806940.1 uracil permease [Thermoanaerobacterium thermosaccharolyticum]